MIAGSEDLRFVITGMPRSGTGYSSTLMTSLGIKCGHEHVFGLSSIMDRSFDIADWQGESSWMAAPFLQELPPSVIVFHQLREPWDCIRSAVGKTPATKPVAKFIQKHIDWQYADNLWETWARMYVHWNTMVERNCRGRMYVRYHVEDMTPEFVCMMLGMIGEPVDVKRVQEVLKTIPTNYNKLKSKPPIWRRSSTIHDRTRVQLVDTIKRYGYTKETPPRK